MVIRILCIAMVVLSLSDDLASQSESSIYSRWTWSPDLPVSYIFLNKQSDFFDEDLNVHFDRSISLGVDFMRYFPNKNVNYSITPKYVLRDRAFGNNSLVRLSEKVIAIDLKVRKLWSSHLPSYQDITRPSVGLGLSLQYGVDRDLEMRIPSAFYEEDALVNGFRVEGLISFALFEDLFNIGLLTPVSKFEINLRFPLLSLSHSLTDKYVNVPQELDFLQKSRDTRLSLELRYTHYIDFEKNVQNNFVVALDTTWSEIQDPIKEYIPPIFNSAPPKQSYYGNFIYSIELYNSLDTLFFVDGEKPIAQGRMFKEFGIGYSFHFFGNHGKFTSKGGYRKLTTLNEQNWRHDVFLSVKLLSKLSKLQIRRLNREALDFHLSYSAGVQLRNVRWNLSMVLGASYLENLRGNKFDFEIKESYPLYYNSSIFLALGKGNSFFKMALMLRDFNLSGGEYEFIPLSFGISFGM